MFQNWFSLIESLRTSGVTLALLLVAFFLWLRLSKLSRKTQKSKSPDIFLAKEQQQEIQNKNNKDNTEQAFLKPQKLNLLPSSNNKKTDDANLLGLGTQVSLDIEKMTKSEISSSYHQKNKRNNNNDETEDEYNEIPRLLKDKIARFYPASELEGDSIVRAPEIRKIYRHFKNNHIAYLFGESCAGKTYLSSLLAKELRLISNYSTLSFSFNEHISDLESAFRVILSEQLGFSTLCLKTLTSATEGLIEILSQGEYLLILDNSEYLDSFSLDFLSSLKSRLGKSKLLLISSESPKIAELEKEAPITFLLPPADEVISEFIRGKIPEISGFGTGALKGFVELLEHNVLVINLLRNLACELLRKEEIQANDLSGALLRIIGDCESRLPDDISVKQKVLAITLNHLSGLERIIMSIFAYMPEGKLSPELLSYLLLLEKKEALNNLCNLASLGFIYKKYNNEFCVHNELKSFLLKYIKLDVKNISALNKKLFEYQYSLGLFLRDKKVLKEGNNFDTFISRCFHCLYVADSGLLASEKLINFAETLLVCLLEKRFIDLVERKLLPIYEEFAKDEIKLPSTEDRAQWQRLLGLGQLMCSGIFENYESFMSESEKSNGIKKLKTGILSLERALEDSLSVKIRRKILSDLGKAEKTLFCLTNNQEHLDAAIQNLEGSRKIEISSDEIIHSSIMLAELYVTKYRLKGDASLLKLSLRIYSELFSSQEQLDNVLKAKIFESVGDIAVEISRLENLRENLRTATENYLQAIELAPEQKKSDVCDKLASCHFRIGKVFASVRDFKLSIKFYESSLEEFVKWQNQSASSNRKNLKAKSIVIYTKIATSYRELATLEDFEKNNRKSVEFFTEALHLAESSNDKSLKKIVEESSEERV